LASHRTWIFNNEATLEIAGQEQPIAYASFDTTLQKKNEVGVTFQFNTNAPLDTMTFVYKTPGAIITKDIRYELRNIALP
jgi:hypothetical protein